MINKTNLSFEFLNKKPFSGIQIQENMQGGASFGFFFGDRFLFNISLFFKFFIL